MNTPVSFPIAKLLKEKGFDEPVINVYSAVFDKLTNITTKIKVNNSLQTAAPTIAEVVMWLYEKHNLFVGVYWCNMGANEYSYKIVDLYNEEEIKDSFFGAGSSYTGTFNSPTEAYEAAIEYTLNNLI